MHDYDRNFYDRKGSKIFKFLMFVMMLVMACFLMDLYARTFYNNSLWDIILNLIGR